MDKSPEAFRTISEVADALDVPPHVLRFWETRFTQVKPVKRGGGRRYYRPEDVRLLRGIRGLLYDDGMTIKGVQKILREKGVRHVIGLGTLADAEAEADAGPRARRAARRRRPPLPPAAKSAPRRPAAEAKPPSEGRRPTDRRRASPGTAGRPLRRGGRGRGADRAGREGRGRARARRARRRQVAEEARRRARGAARGDGRRPPSGDRAFPPCPRRGPAIKRWRRAIAQSGSAFDWGSKGREFESR